MNVKKKVINTNVEKYNNVNSKFEISKINGNEYEINIITEMKNGKSSKVIPEIVTLQIDIKNKTIKQNNNVLAMYGMLEKTNEKSTINHVDAQTPVTVINVDTDKKIDVLQKVAGKVFSASSVTANWFVWSVQKSLSILYNTLDITGPLSIPTWGFLICLMIPNSFPLVEKSGIYFITNYFKMVNMINVTSSPVMSLILNMIQYSLPSMDNYNFLKSSTFLYIQAFFSGNLMGIILKQVNNPAVSKFIESPIFKMIYASYENKLLYNGSNYKIIMN
jgi:hypothetical protein